MGLGKARAIPDAIRKGVEAAKRNMMTVPMVDSTIPHDVQGHWGASQVIIRPASPGTGVVAGGAVRPILELAGVKDVLAKAVGSRNPINSAWATLESLKKLRRAAEVSQARGVAVEEMVPWMKTAEKAAEEPAEAAESEGTDSNGDA